MNIPQIPLNTGGYRVPTLDELDKRPRETTPGEAVGAAFEAAQDDTLGSILQRVYANSEVKQYGGETKISPEEANARYPDMPQPFREPVSPYLAGWQHELHKDRKVLQEKIDNGPQDAWTKSKMFGVGLAAHMLDPVELGAGMIAGWGAGAAVARTAWGARLAAAGTTGARVGMEAIEATTGNLIQNVGQEGLLIAAKSQEGEEYDYAEGLQQLAINTLAGTVMHFGIKEASAQAGRLIGTRAEKLPTRLQELTAAFDEHLDDQIPGKPRPSIIEEALTRSQRLREMTATFDESLSENITKPVDPEVFHGNTRARMLQNTSPEAEQALARATVGNLERDMVPDPGPVLEALARETDVNPGDFGHTRYEYIPATPENIRSKRFYSATREATDLKAGTHAPVGDSYNMGMTVTDNPGVANVAAARSMADNLGAVHEIEVSVKNPLDLNSAVPENLRTQVETIMTHLEEEMPATMRDALDIMQVAVDEGVLSPDFMQSMAKEVQAQGYDALIHDGAKHMGVEHSPHNVIEILDTEGVTAKNSFEPDRRMVRQPSREQLQALADRAQKPNHLLYNREAVENFIKEAEGLDQPKANRVLEARTTLQEQMAELESLETQGHFDASELQILEQLKKEFGDQDAIDSLLVNAANCVRH